MADIERTGSKKEVRKMRHTQQQIEMLQKKAYRKYDALQQIEEQYKEAVIEWHKADEKWRQVYAEWREQRKTVY